MRPTSKCSGHHIHIRYISDYGSIDKCMNWTTAGGNDSREFFVNLSWNSRGKRIAVSHHDDAHDSRSSDNWPIRSIDSAIM